MHKEFIVPYKVLCIYDLERLIIIEIKLNRIRTQDLGQKVHNLKSVIQSAYSLLYKVKL